MVEELNNEETPIEEKDKEEGLATEEEADKEEVEAIDQEEVVDTAVEVPEEDAAAEESEIEEEAEIQSEEETDEDAMNNEVAEMKSFSVGEIVSGKVTKVEEKQAFVDVGFKVDGIVPISELSSLHVERVSDILTVDDELELKVIKLEDDELILSKRAVEAEKAW